MNKTILYDTPANIKNIFNDIFRKRTNAFHIRHHPERQKTPEDLAAIAAAQEKRKRRAEKKRIKKVIDIG